MAFCGIHLVLIVDLYGTYKFQYSLQSTEYKYFQYTGSMHILPVYTGQLEKKTAPAINAALWYSDANCQI